MPVGDQNSIQHLGTTTSVDLLRLDAVLVLAHDQLRASASILRSVGAVVLLLLELKPALDADGHEGVQPAGDEEGGDGPGPQQGGEAGGDGEGGREHGEGDAEPEEGEEQAGDEDEGEHAGGEGGEEHEGQQGEGELRDEEGLLHSAGSPAG